MVLEDIHFDTQSPQYRLEGHAFFIPLLIGGHILVPIMILAAHISKNRFSRSPIFMNFCYANVGYSTSLLLSYYAGDGVWASPKAPHIDWGPCGFQVIATQLTTFWMCMCALCLCLQLWFTLGNGDDGRKYKSDDPGLWPRNIRETILTVLPYCFMPLFALMVGIAMLARPELVTLNYLFCGFDFQPLRTATAACDFLVMIANFLVLCDIGRKLYTRTVRLAIDQTRVQGWRAFSLYWRICFFTIPSVLSLPAAVIAGVDDTTVRVRMFIQATFPLLFFLGFGTSLSVYLPNDTRLDFSKFPRIALRTIPDSPTYENTRTRSLV